MNSEEWDDDEPDYPRAPLPPHERVWRHPSELGGDVQYQPLPPRRSPRFMMVGAGVATVVLVAGLVQILAPRGGSRVVGTSSQSIDAGAQPEAAATRTTVRRPRRTTVATTPRNRRPASLARTGKSLSTMLLANAQRVAVAVGDGRHAFTISASLETGQQVEVLVSDGVTISARVVSVNSTTNLAVLELERVMSGVARQVAYESPADGDHVMVGSGANDAYVRVTPLGLQLDTEASAREGEPVVDERGKLVGLISRGSDGVLRLITIPRLAALQATVIVIDVWLGLSFEPSTLLVSEAQTDAPAALAGVVAGDTLTSIEGVPLSSIDDLWLELAGMKAGRTVRIEFVRQGEPQQVDITLAERPT